MSTRLGYLAVMIGFQLGACAANDPVGIDPGEAAGDGKADGTVSASLPDVRCTDAPTSVPTHSFRHFGSKVLAELGDPHHRGIDLVAAASETEQVIEGEISYTIGDKALEDEDVDVFACRSHVWKHLGKARTDDEGHFALSLGGTSRLPIGMRDMYVSVEGDQTGAFFLAIVAKDDRQLAVSDVDGTLTSSETAYIPIVSTDPEIQAGAVAAWKRVKATGAIPVYVTARARSATQDTRDWLAEKGMPRGALRLASHLMLPGAGTADYKAGVFEELQTHLTMTLGVGNRASDVDAYTRAGLPGDRIFMKLPEFSDELADHLTNGDAVGIESYDDLLP